MSRGTRPGPTIWYTVRIRINVSAMMPPTASGSSKGAAKMRGSRMLRYPKLRRAVRRMFSAPASMSFGLSGVM